MATGRLRGSRSWTSCARAQAIGLFVASIDLVEEALALALIDATDALDTNEIGAQADDHSPAPFGFTTVRHALRSHHGADGQSDPLAVAARICHGRPLRAKIVAGMRTRQRRWPSTAA